MRRARIIHLGKFYHPEPGGMETHLYDLCTELQQRHDVQAVVANTCSRTAFDLVDSVPVTRVANYGSLFSSPLCPAFPQHVHRLNSIADAIFHLHLPNPLAHFSYLLARPNGKLVITWHSDIVKQRFLSRLYNQHLEGLLARADRIIATSPNYIQSSPFLSKFSDKCRVVPLGIRTEKFQITSEVRSRVAAIRRRYGDRIALFVGRFTYYKGLDDLIAAAEDLRCRLLLIGKGPQQKQLERRIAANGLQDKVFLLSGVDDAELVAHYHASDLFVLPSNRRSEAFGLVQLEAMACGKPVVSTNLETGVPWVNQHGRTGLVVPVNDPVRLASAVNRLLDQTEERRSYGANARRRVLENFTISKVTKELEQVYREVLAPQTKSQLDNTLHYSS